MRTGISLPLIFVIISFLVAALVYSSLSIFIVVAAPRDPNSESGNCRISPPGEGAHLETCCWTESVPPGTGNPELGGDKEEYCQTCYFGTGDVSPFHCTDKEFQFFEGKLLDSTAPLQGGVLEQPPRPPTFGPVAPLQGGVFEQQEQPPTPPSFAPGTSPGVLQQLEQGEGFSPWFLQPQQGQPPGDQGAAQLPPPATEGTQPATVEEEPPVPVCQEGLEFNEDLGFCVPTECPEGQELNEDTGICVLEEQQPAADEEPEEQQQTEENQPSEVSGSEDSSNN